MLTLHNLKVCQKALAFGAQAEAFSSGWGRRHAIVEHFRRAAESIVLNIAEAARLQSAPDKARTLDYAIAPVWNAPLAWISPGLRGGRPRINRSPRKGAFWRSRGC
jgi:hypothetical protein